MWLTKNALQVINSFAMLQDIILLIMKKTCDFGSIPLICVLLLYTDAEPDKDFNYLHFKETTWNFVMFATEEIRKSSLSSLPKFSICG